MRIIDSHVHLGDIYVSDPNYSIENCTPQTTHPEKPNLYERIGFANIYFGKLNYLFKPLIVSPAKTMAGYANLPSLIKSLSKNQIEKAVVFPVEPFVSTESLLKACQTQEQLIPFCSVHPYDREKKEKLKRYFNAGCRGLKLHPVIQQVPPDDPAFFEVLEEIRPYQVPVILHAGWGAIGKGSFGFARHFQNLLQSFKNIKFILAHIGFYEPAPFIELAEKHKNVYFDTSWQPAGIIKKALNKLGEDRLMFGSDWPFSLQQTSLGIIEKVTKGNLRLKEKILYRNAQSVISGI